MGFDLNCRLCSNPIKPFDEVESKASGSGYADTPTGPKLYHAECYDDAHLLVEYTEEYLRDCYEDEGEEHFKQIYWEFDVDAPENATLDEMIEEILELELKWILKNKNT